ncbi:GSCOCG00004372001-RA-CDS, partial [Cotesia congregata]
MRLLGVAREGINLFCNMMDICNGLSESTYNAIVLLLHTTTQSLFKASCVKAIDEEKSENEKHERPILNLKVSGDGTWKKRGFKSMYGVTTLIGYYSGKVIDLVVKSSFCAACARWKNKTDTEEYRQWFEEYE